jgi:alkylation response protein AidB-like acyl-CoA dehydrogenase
MELKDVRVPMERALGPFEDQAPLQFVKLMQDMALTMAAVGLLQRTVASTKDYAQSHLREGRPIFRHQEIRFKLADMVTLSQTAQLMAFRAGWLYSISDPEAAVLIRCTKVFAAEAAEQAASMAMQVSAGEGYLWDSPIQQAYRESKYSSIAGTTSEVARMFIADDLLKRYQV